MGGGHAARGPAQVDASDRQRVASSRLTGEPPSDETTSEGLRDRVHEALGDARHADVRVLPDGPALAEALADELTERVGLAVADRGRADVALTGGPAVLAVVSALARRASDLDRGVWRRVHLWWADECYLPAGDPGRNDVRAEDAGLADLPVLRKHVHSMPSGRSPGQLGETAARYAVELAEHAPATDGGAGEVDAAVPPFDVILLGVGADGHIASLFPASSQLRLVSTTTAAVTAAPDEPALRVTLTLPALRTGRAVWLVAVGGELSDVVERSLRSRDDQALPASCVRGMAETVWWTDRAAAPTVRSG